MQVMPDNGVCAVVVTYKPEAYVVENLRKVRPQVEHLVVVDNGSSALSLAPIRDSSREMGFDLIENGSNLGIAEALNIGVRRGEDLGAKWVLLLDQDSTVTDEFARQLLSDFELHAANRSVKSIVPRYVDPKSGVERTFALDKEGAVFIAITSGSFFPIEIFKECGYFQQELFVYTVDDEYSLRLRLKGYKIMQSRTAILLHASGFPIFYRAFGRTLFRASNHSATARYYLNRNRVWMVRAYGRKFPSWTYAVVAAFFKETLKILAVEPSRWLKIVRTAQGIYDGVLGRMGKKDGV
jgi:rhamnosyltransferase